MIDSNDSESDKTTTNPDRLLVRINMFPTYTSHKQIINITLKQKKI